MQVIVCVQFQRIFEENSPSHQEMMQPVRNVENYPTCKVTATSMSSNIYEVIPNIHDKRIIYSKEKKILQARKEYFNFVSAALNISVFSTVLIKYFFSYFY